VLSLRAYLGRIALASLNSSLSDAGVNEGKAKQKPPGKLGPAFCCQIYPTGQCKTAASELLTVYRIRAGGHSMSHRLQPSSAS